MLWKAQCGTIILEQNYLSTSFTNICVMNICGMQVVDAVLRKPQCGT